MSSSAAASPEQVRWVVWFVLLASVLVYFGMAISGLLKPASALGPDWLPSVFGGVAVAAAAAAHWLWRRATGAGLPIHRAQSGRPALAAMLGQRLLLAWALDEAIGVLGLAVALLGFPKEEWFLFFVVSLALLLAHRPVNRPA
ncbi:MAG TPA: hypothetical protein VLW45_05045 [Pelomicrobium sp.]|nr:hypothetical protein [Pelomicrobium sp.]